MATKRPKGRLMKLANVVRSIDGAIADQMSGCNSRRTLQADCLVYGTYHDLAKKDFEPFLGMTLKQIIEEIGAARLPFDPKMTGRISQEKYSKLADERRKKIAEKFKQE